MKTLIAALCLGWLSVLGAATPLDSLNRLMDGNKRYVSGNLTHPDRLKEARAETVNSQAPFAIVMGCSDSRVPPEIIFDQGIGDIFTVRDAGNVIGPVELDSIEYSIGVLGSSILVVLGHQNCGAVKAVRDGQGKAIPAVAALISPCVADEKTLEDAVKDNAINQMRRLISHPRIEQYMRKGQLMVVAAYYHLGTGEVEMLMQSPVMLNNGATAAGATMAIPVPTLSAGSDLNLDMAVSGATAGATAPALPQW